MKLERQFFLDLAARGVRMPVGTDMVLREKPGHAEILRDATRLGKVVEESARRWNTPLAIPLMDLTLEKDLMLTCMGIPPEEVAEYQFRQPPPGGMVAALEEGLEKPFGPRLKAQVEAVGYIAHKTDLVPCGMVIGPFSLVAKTFAETIPAVFASASGDTAEDSEEVKALEDLLELGTRVILRSVNAQIRAGAKVIVVAEPAASVAYFSPRQLEAGSDTFDRYVLAFNRRITEKLAKAGVQLFFHCCGELVDPYVGKFASLNPVILSLGSSRALWKDSALVPKDIVLYGNMPTKKFLLEELTVKEVERLAAEIVQKMRETGHPHILGSECDVLSVPGREKIIMEKVWAFLKVAA